MNIVANRSKVMLTSLGIIVGSATIVLVLAIGRGGQADVADQFKNLNAGAIDVEAVTAAQAGPAAGPAAGGPAAGGPPAPPAGGPQAGGRGGAARVNNRQSNVVTLTTDDVEDIAALVPGLDEVTILVQDSAPILGGELEEEQDATVAGVLENYPAVSNLSLLYGEFFTAEDDAVYAYVTVIGYSLAQELFTYPSLAYGDYLNIDGKNYEIIGVLEEMGAVTSGLSPDETVFIPYSTAVKYIFGSSVRPTITAVASDVSGVETAMENIKTILSENHPNGYFSVTDAGSAMEAATSSANTLAMLLFAVATIVFIVGGIGIMNVLFVTIKDRTREIGVLKALGAQAGVILLQFLLESVSIGAVGGLLGLACSAVGLWALKFTGMPLSPSVQGAAVAFVFALLTSAVFGFYPAWKASCLKPVDALSYE